MGGNNAVPHHATPADAAPLHDDGRLHGGIPVHEDVVVHAGLEEGRPAAKGGPPAHVAGPFDGHALLHHGLGRENHGSGDLGPRHGDLLPASSDDLHARAPQVPRASDVHPQAADLYAVEGHSLLQQQREHVLREVKRLPLGDVIQDLRLQDVDPRVHQIREDFLGLRLLLEAHDAPILVQLHNPKLRRVFHAGQRQRGRRPRLLVALVELAHIHISEHVAAGHHEGVLDEVRHPLHGPRRPRGGRLEGVEDGGVVLQPVPDALHHPVRHVARGDDHLPEAGGHQRAEDEVDARATGHWEEGLGHALRQGLEPGPKPAGEDDGLHAHSSSLRLSWRMESASSTASSTASSSSRACRVACRRVSMISRASCASSPRAR